MNNLKKQDHTGHTSKNPLEIALINKNFGAAECMLRDLSLKKAINTYSKFEPISTLSKRRKSFCDQNMSKLDLRGELDHVSCKSIQYKRPHRQELMALKKKYGIKREEEVKI